MSWLRNHLRHYTVPGIKAIIDAHKKKGVPIKKAVHSYGSSYGYGFNQDSSDAQVSVTADMIGPPIGMRSSKDAVCSEAGYVLAALESFGVINDLEPETIQAIKTLKTEFFITNSRYELTNSSKTDVSKEDQIHNIIKKSFYSLRRIVEKDPLRRLVLTGRDVWLWEVMARKKNVPTIFDPRVSRKVASNIQFDALVKTWHIDSSTIIFDTGFAGSIYDAICRSASKVQNKDIKGINLMLSTNCKDADGTSQQLYPNHKNARAKALAIEYLPKYQKSGTVKDGQIVQYLADLDEFVKAAALTIWFWHHESPKWIDQGGTRCKGPSCPGCKCCKLWRKDVDKEASVIDEQPTLKWPTLKWLEKMSYWAKKEAL